MGKVYLNNRGLTLIELLGSITLLGIVIVSFFSIFSQSTIFSSKVEDKLTAINVAENVLSDIKNNNANYGSPCNINGKYYYPNVTYPAGTDAENQLDLERVDIKIYMNQNYSSDANPITEIYGYINMGGQ